jgi:hypothetical protein
LLPNLLVKHNFYDIKSGALTPQICQLYYPAIIKREDRTEYITTLNQANDGDIFPFLVLVANSVLETERIIYLDSKIMMEEE